MPRQAIWSLRCWYKLAEVNGLTGDEALIEGTLLNIPPGVIRNTYTADTFTPCPFRKPQFSGILK